MNEDLHGKQPQGEGVKEESEVSAKDMALLADRLITDYPEVLKTTSIAKTKFRAGTDDEMDMPNWNFMLKGLVSEYPGVDGLKRVLLILRDLVLQAQHSGTECGSSPLY